MIKKIGYFLILVSIVLLIFGYFRYNPTLDYKDKIPQTAETVIQVNLREIEYGLVMDFFRNPLSYKSGSETKKKDTLSKSKSFYKCVNIPVNTFFYTNKTIFENCFISSFFNLKDEVSIKKIFKKEKYKKVVYSEVNVYQKGNLFFALKENQLVCFFKTGKINVASIVAAVFANTEYLDVNNSLITKLKKSNSSITIVTLKNDFIAFDLNAGFLEVNGQFNKEFNAVLPNESKSFGDSLLINVSGKLNTTIVKDNLTDSHKVKFKKWTTLSLDSILNSWNGDLSFNLASFNQKTDTIITYEYDDDFNKIEKKSIAKNTIPLATLVVEDNQSKLKNYLLSKNVVQEIEGEDILAIMPLFKTVVFNQKNNLWITSGNNDVGFSKSSEKFKIFFNVHNYKKNSEGLFKVSNKYFNLMKTVQLSIDANNTLKARVDLEDESRFFLTQLILA